MDEAGISVRGVVFDTSQVLLYQCPEDPLATPDNDQLDISFGYYSPSGRVTCTIPAYFCTYTPNANFTGTDTLTYYVNDKDNSAQGSVTVTVSP